MADCAKNVNAGTAAARTLSATVVLLTTACSVVPARPEIKTFAESAEVLAAYRATMLAGQRDDRHRYHSVVQKLDGAGFTPDGSCARGGGDCDMVQRTGLPAAASTTPVVLTTASTQSVGVELGPDGKPLELPPIPDVCLAPRYAPDIARVAPTLVRDNLAGRPTERALFAALDDYAKALRAVASAEDRAALDAANQKLVASITALATTLSVVSGGIGAPAGAVAGAVASLVLEIRTAVLERQRFVALRTVLQAGCVPLRTMALGGGLILEARRGDRLSMNSTVMRRAGELTLGLDRHRRVTPAETSWAFAVAQKAADSSASLQASPWQAARALVIAHNALVVTVVEGRGQGVDLLTAVGNFADSIRQLREAMDAADTARRTAA